MYRCKSIIAYFFLLLVVFLYSHNCRIRYNVGTYIYIVAIQSCRSEVYGFSNFFNFVILTYYITSIKCLGFVYIIQTYNVQ